MGAAARWRSALDDLAEKLAAFGAAGLDGRVSRLEEIGEAFGVLSGQSGERGSGAFYADRSVLFEECLGDVDDCVLGGALATELTGSLQPILGLWEAQAALLARREQRAARAVWRRLGGHDGAGVPLVRFLQAAVHASSSSDAPPDDELERLRTQLADLVRSAGERHRVRLRPEQLPTFAELDDGLCPYTSIDVQIAARSETELREGRYRIVLGEAHPQPLLWVFPTAHFLRDARQAILAPLEQAMSGCSRMAPPPAPEIAQLAYRRKSKIYPYALPGPVIELSPRHETCAAIPAASVEVRDLGSRLALWAGDRALILHPPLIRRAAGGDPLVPLSLAPIEPLDIDLGPHTPRIEIGNVVYQRERWRRRGGALTAAPCEGFDLFAELWRFKQREGLPDEVFVRLSNEPKPIYVDFANFFLLELLDHLARQSAALTITEMLPASDDLWLQSRGGKHCCELRTMAIREE